jgi:predicted porin
MKKRVSLIAAAVGAALATPAAVAQSSNVQLYGRANLGLDVYEATGARDQTVTGASCTLGTAGCQSGSSVDRESRVRVFDNSSRVGLRGTEDLGNGLKAIFQIETGVNIDNGAGTGQGGQVNANANGAWASRDSFVGLDTNFGRLTLGRQSLYWANGVNAQFGANYINTEIPWTNGIILGRISTFNVQSARVSNVVQYSTPTFAGLNGTLSYSPNFQEAVQNPGAGSEPDGRIWAATVRGEWGPWYAQVDYSDIDGNSSTTGAPRGAAQLWKVGGSWGYMPGARIGLIWVRTESNVGAGLVLGDKTNQDGWTLNWEHTFGNFQVMAQYGQLNDMKNCDANAIVSCSNTKARGYMIGGRYLLSKRTWLYASWNMVDNKDNQFVDYAAAAITSTNLATGAPTAYGADPQIWALGIMHQF